MLEKDIRINFLPKFESDIPYPQSQGCSVGNCPDGFREFEVGFRAFGILICFCPAILKLREEPGLDGNQNVGDFGVVPRVSFPAVDNRLRKTC